jgi:hypothetical protein
MKEILEPVLKITGITDIDQIDCGYDIIGMVYGIFLPPQSLRILQNKEGRVCKLSNRAMCCMVKAPIQEVFFS